MPRSLADAISASIVRSEYPEKSAKYLAELRYRMRRLIANKELGICTFNGCRDEARVNHKGKRMIYCEAHQDRVNARQKARNLRLKKTNC